jgi:hypothetical protein
MPENDREMIRKFWQYPQLRGQIPNLIDIARKKYFSLVDATDKAEQRWHDMEGEYSKLREAENASNRK